MDVATLAVVSEKDSEENTPMELNADPASTIGATEAYKAEWHEKYGKEAEEAPAEEIELSAEVESTYGATEAYKAAWHEKYGNAEPAKSASKADWVAYATATGQVTEADAEAMTRDELVDAYSGSGIASAPSQGSSQAVTTADADAASGTAEPGAGVDSGTPEGSATTTGTSSAGARAKA